MGGLRVLIGEDLRLGVRGLSWLDGGIEVGFRVCWKGLVPDLSLHI